MVEDSVRILILKFKVVFCLAQGSRHPHVLLIITYNFEFKDVSLIVSFTLYIVLVNLRFEGGRIYLDSLKFLESIDNADIGGCNTVYFQTLENPEEHSHRKTCGSQAVELEFDSLVVEMPWNEV